MRFFNTEGPVRPDDHYTLPPLTRWDLDETRPSHYVITGRRGGFQTRPYTKGLSGYQVARLYRRRAILSPVGSPRSGRNIG
jgi:hypothetical protein